MWMRIVECHPIAWYCHFLCKSVANPTNVNSPFLNKNIFNGQTGLFCGYLIFLYTFIFCGYLFSKLHSTFFISTFYFHVPLLLHACAIHIWCSEERSFFRKAIQMWHFLLAQCVEQWTALEKNMILQHCCEMHILRVSVCGPTVVVMWATECWRK